MAGDPLNSAAGPALVRWHKRLLNQLMERFNLSLYAMLWLSFAKGVIAFVLLEALFDF